MSPLRMLPFLLLPLTFATLSTVSLSYSVVGFEGVSSHFAEIEFSYLGALATNLTVSEGFVNDMLKGNWVTIEVEGQGIKSTVKGCDILRSMGRGVVR